jgi:hypothetical protein
VRDQTDDEITSGETGGRDLIALSGDTWSALTRAAAATELLDVAEIGGITAATEWLDHRGLNWSVPTPAPLRARTWELSPQTLREARAVLDRPPATSPVVSSGGLFSPLTITNVGKR